MPSCQLAARRRRSEATAGGRSRGDTLPEDVVALLDALARLGEADRRVVVLSLVGGLTAFEIGQVIDASPGAVRVRLHRARRRLRAAALGAEPWPEAHELDEDETMTDDRLKTALAALKSVAPLVRLHDVERQLMQSATPNAIS